MNKALNTTKFLELVRQLKAKNTDDRQWEACCPAHEDKTASLSLKLADDQKILMYCHAGCETESILAALGLEMKDLFHQPKEQTPRKEIVAEYNYTDETGNLQFQVVRYKPKGFGQRRPCLLYTSPSPRDATLSRMPSSA